MKKKILLISLFSLIYSCSFNTNLSNESTINISSKKERFIENDVSIDRLKNNLAILSGNSPFGQILISERGTVEGRLKTREFLFKKLSELGYKVEKQSYRKNGENIYVKLMADIPTDEYILVGAHMDSVRNAGANDNGTGSVENVDLTPHYHKKSDIYENIHFSILEAGTKLLTAVISDLALGINYPSKTKFIPHDNFPGRDRHFDKF